MGQPVRGVAPGFLLLPAREYRWELKNRVEIRVPLKGSINELLGSKTLVDGVKIAGDDEFAVIEEDLLYLWEIIRVLFAKAEYPELRDNECLNVVTLERHDDELILYGEIITSLD
jgi:hypothetical protein